MWELFQRMQKYNLNPNQTFLLLCFFRGFSPNEVSPDDKAALVKLKYINLNADGKGYIITHAGTKIVKALDSYFNIKSNKTAKALMGDFHESFIIKYREMFPAGKLPSGVPSRNNVKILTENFRWFFDEYDYTWAEILKATKMYINEYQKENFLYMQNSQYFVSKQDKHKVKTSKLADYCDMIRDGVATDDEDHFKEKVV